MTAAVWVLIFAVCAAGSDLEGAPIDACEHGEVRARSCTAGEAWIRAALRPTQTLHLMGCEREGVAS